MMTHLICLQDRRFSSLSALLRTLLPHASVAVSRPSIRPTVFLICANETKYIQTFLSVYQPNLIQQ
jgi:hypothetical protein